MAGKRVRGQAATCWGVGVSRFQAPQHSPRHHTIAAINMIYSDLGSYMDTALPRDCGNSAQRSTVPSIRSLAPVGSAPQLRLDPGRCQYTSQVTLGQYCSIPGLLPARVHGPCAASTMPLCCADAFPPPFPSHSVTALRCTPQRTCTALLIGGLLNLGSGSPLLPSSVSAWDF